MPSSRKTLIGFAVSTLFLALFLRQLDGLHVGAALANADYRWLVVAVPVYFAGVWFRTLRWQALLANLRSIPAYALFRHVVIGYMANDLLPARTGELVRTYLAGRSFNLPRSPILGTIALERISDGLTLVAFMALAAAVAPLAGWMTGVLLLMGVVFVGAIAGLGLLMAKRHPVEQLWIRFGGRLPAVARDSMGRIAAGMLQGFSTLREPRLLARVALHAALSWGWEAVVFYLTGIALGIEVPLLAYVLAMCTANLATALPSSQAGIGPFEFFCAETLLLYGTSASDAAAFALLVHAVLIVPVVLAGLVYLARENTSFRGLMRDAAGPAQQPEVL